jgi:hypothetical protein
MVRFVDRRLCRTMYARTLQMVSTWQFGGEETAQRVWLDEGRMVVVKLDTAPHLRSSFDMIKEL